MKYVLTLVGKPLMPAQAEAARRAVGTAAAPDWLAAGEACDLAFDGQTPIEAEAAARAALPGQGIDLLAQPAVGRRRKLLLADMDSTIITVECIDEMADQLGLKDVVSRITERSMRGEIDFPTALRERAAMLRGLPESALQAVYDRRVRLTPGARTLVRTMRAHGAYTALVSGGFTFFTERVREAAGFDEDQANRLNIRDGVLDGTVAEPILDADAKLAALRRLTAARALSPAETLCIGDGANDRPMIEAAGLGVAFRAKPVLVAAARARVDHTDLTAVLYFQGYRSSEFRD